MGALPADLRKLGPKGPFLLAISRDIIAHLHGSVSAQTPRIVTIKVVAFLLVSSVYTWWHHVRAMHACDINTTSPFWTCVLGGVLVFTQRFVCVIIVSVDIRSGSYIWI